MIKVPKRLFALTYKHIRLSFGSDARSKIARGMRIMAEVTSKTYGPGGRNVAMEYDLRDPKITKDGVTVAKSVFFQDREEELGAKLLKRIAHNTNTYAGDGTTLSTFFSAALVTKAWEAIENGIHPVFLKNGIEKSKKATLDIMQQFVMPVTNKKELLDICLVASNHNTEIANIVAEAISTVDISNGFQGNLEIEESKTGKNELKITKGLFIKRGYVSEQFWATQFGNPVLKEVTLDHPLILVVHDIVSENEEIVKIMDIAAINKRPLLIFSMDMQEGPLSTMLYNAKKDVLGWCAVNIPFMAGKEEDFLEDVAVITGSKLIKNDGISEGFEDITLEHFGSAQKVHIGEFDTQIIGGAGTEEQLKLHIENIQYDIEKEDSKHFKKIMKERITRLNQTQAVIGVGGESEVVIGENRDLIVDSLNSARASLESGVLPGGGTALYHASKLIPVYTTVDMAQENVGVKIFQEALREAIERIIGNAIGYEHVGHIIEKIDETSDFLVGYNVRTQKVENMMEAGVVDSYKVIKTIIEDSTTLSNLIIMTEWNVIKRKEYTPLPLEEHHKYREWF